MVTVLRTRGKVFASDLRDVSCDWPRLDFLAARTARFSQTIEPFRAIVTNPPYSHAYEFLVHALELMKPCGGMVAMLLDHDYDTAMPTRGHLFRKPPFAAKLVVGKRISWIGLPSDKVGRRNHSWYVFDWQHSGHALALYPP